MSVLLQSLQYLSLLLQSLQYPVTTYPVTTVPCYVFRSYYNNLRVPLFELHWLE